MQCKFRSLLDCRAGEGGNTWNGVKNASNRINGWYVFPVTSYISYRLGK